MKYSNMVLRNVALNLGNPIGNFGIPLIVSFVVVGLAVKPLQGHIGNIGAIAIWISASLGLAWGLGWLYTVSVGKRILAAIERDYGPKTSKTVYRLTGKTKEGDYLDLDIPAVARAYGEA